MVVTNYGFFRQFEDSSTHLQFKSTAESIFLSFGHYHECHSPQSGGVASIDSCVEFHSSHNTYADCSSQEWGGTLFTNHTKQSSSSNDCFYSAKCLIQGMAASFRNQIFHDSVISSSFTLCAPEVFQPTYGWIISFHNGVSVIVTQNNVSHSYCHNGVFATNLDSIVSTFSFNHFCGNDGAIVYGTVTNKNSLTAQTDNIINNTNTVKGLGLFYGSGSITANSIIFISNTHTTFKSRTSSFSITSCILYNNSFTDLSSYGLTQVLEKPGTHAFVLTLDCQRLSHFFSKKDITSIDAFIAHFFIVE